MGINLYSSSLCGKCKMLNTKLKEKGIVFNNLEDDEIPSEKEEYILKNFGGNLPVLEVDGTFMDFLQAINWLREV